MASHYPVISRQIRAERVRLGWKQADLGAVLHPPRSHAAVSDIERGKTKLNVDQLQDVADVLGVALATLLWPVLVVPATAPPSGEE